MKQITLLFLLLLVSTAFAHQPRIADEGTLIENPEVSQAFYAELDREPEYYTINSETDFNLYVGLLVPALEDIDKDVSAEISKDSQVLYTLDGLTANWTYYYEEYAGDEYYAGPELGENFHNGIPVKAGEYTIKVYSPDNQGKYVLVVGEKEEFPLNEQVNVIKTIPKLKTDFFEKPAYEVLSGRLAGMFVVSVLVLVVLAGLIWWKIKRK